jgi:hypothetical protein
MKVLELLTFDGAHFRWKHNGKLAGSAKSHGYRKIKNHEKEYYEHHLVWFLHTGRKAQLDHINGNRADNRLENLREATQSENLMNTARRSDNRSGYKGVGWHKHSQKWQARIKIPNGKHLHLGYFNAPEDAHAAYKASAQEHFGDFARYE